MPSQVDTATNLAQLKHQQATAALAEQQRTIERWRSRAGTLFTGAAVATSFLGSESLRLGAPSGLSWCAIACFLGVGAIMLAIHWPRPDLELVPQPIPTGERLWRADRQHDLALVLTVLTRTLDAAYSRNEPFVARLASLVQAESILVALAVLWWVADLATRS
jgi:uncharacterized membrane protein YfcA